MVFIWIEGVFVLFGLEDLERVEFGGFELEVEECGFDSLVLRGGKGKLRC